MAADNNSPTMHNLGRKYDRFCRMLLQRELQICCRSDTEPVTKSHHFVAKQKGWDKIGEYVSAPVRLGWIKWKLGHVLGQVIWPNFNSSGEFSCYENFAARLPLVETEDCRKTLSQQPISPRLGESVLPVKPYLSIRFTKSTTDLQPPSHGTPGAKSWTSCAGGPVPHRTGCESWFDPVAIQSTLMKSIIHQLTAACVVLATAAVVFADADFFAPTIDPNDVAPAKLNGVPIPEEAQPVEPKKLDPPADDSKSNVDPYDVGAELKSDALQQCAAQGGAMGPPMPPPEVDGSPSPAAATPNGTGAPSSAGNMQAGGSSSAGCNSDNACSGLDDGGCHPWWVRVDYLALWIQANHLPPLVTTSPPGTPQADAGVLPDARVLFGGNYIDGGARNGGRVTLGYWFDDDQMNGLRASWFTVLQPTGAANFFANSDGSTILARPFTSGGIPNAQLAAFVGPGLNVIGQPGTPATIGVTSTSTMDFAEIAFSHVFERNSGAQLSWLAGYRHLEFRENLTIFENVIVTDTLGDQTALNVLDQFQTKSEFDGGQLGVEFMCHADRWALDGSFQLGFGNVHEWVNIIGNTVTTDSSGNMSNGPGLFAQPTNDGVHSRNEFAFLPEMELNLHYQLTDQIELTMGYTFLYLTRVIRAGDQIDTNVSSTTLPTARPTTGVGNQPAEMLRDTSMWAQGISGGIELRF
jgi:hypothetical protein